MAYLSFAFYILVVDPCTGLRLQTFPALRKDDTYSCLNRRSPPMVTFSNMDPARVLFFSMDACDVVSMAVTGRQMFSVARCDKTLLLAEK